MKILILITLLSGTAFAGETWNKTKAQINEAAEGTDRVTRETIHKGKAKWQERQEESDRKKEAEERAEYKRLKEKYGKDDV